MKILFYCLPINESFYAQYNINGLRANGHEVISTIEYRPDQYHQFNDPKFLDTFDIVVYMGFSFGNMTMHQGLSYSPAIQTKTPVVVMYYDNPFRYMPVIRDHSDRKANFKITCCDSELSDRLQQYGIDCMWMPTCYDPTIQKTGAVNPDMAVDIAFAGTVLTPEKIEGMYRGLDYRSFEILQQAQSRRTAGQFFDYVDHIANYVPIDSTQFGDLAFRNLMTQKFMLRMEMFDAARCVGDLHVWGKGDWQGMDRVTHHGNLNQHTELPEMYRSAKINLSIELLPSSVHQRCIEVAGCGGFILLEDKADNKLCFDSPFLTESIVWRSLGELREKVQHYLSNPVERNAIAKILHDECKEKHTNIVRMREFIEAVVK